MTVGNSQPRGWSDSGTNHSRPNFFVIGAQKAGTTRLCNLLNRHPSVGIPIKEPFYFQSAAATAENAEWYQSIFEDVAGLAARGDGSTYYSMCGVYPGTARRIHQFSPDARIIYMVRHPLRRIESAWVQWLSVRDANALNDDGVSPFTVSNVKLGFDHNLYNTEVLIDPSLYWKQLVEYRRYFADDQIRVGFFEDFVADERTELRACLAFLGVDSSIHVEADDDDAKNTSAGKRQRLAVVDTVRALPGYKRVNRFIPQGLKTLTNELMTRSIPLKSPWTAESLEWAASRVADDSAAVLQYAGRSDDYWFKR